MKHLRKVFIYIILVYLKTKKKIACEYQTFSFNLQIEKESKMKKKCILSLGSNEEAEKNMQFMCQRLIEKFPGILLSKAVYTEPVDFFSEKHFLNRTAILETEMNVEQIKTYLKDIEKECGRTETDKAQGIIRADIDLVQYGDAILKPKDINRPDIHAGIIELQH